MNLFNACFLAMMILAGCGKPDTAPSGITGPGSNNMIPVKDSLTYLALGDSYTVGTSVTADQSFPVQLVAALNRTQFKTRAPKIVAQNGFTTGDLNTFIPNANIKPPYHFVTLLIGVNNQFRGFSREDYRKDFAALLKQAVAYAGGNARRVIVISIPDYGVTPFAEKMDRQKIFDEINAFNNINETEAQLAGTFYCNITETSRLAFNNPTLVASDGLHLSGAMYALWIDRLVNLVAQGQ